MCASVCWPPDETLNQDSQELCFINFARLSVCRDECVIPHRLPLWPDIVDQLANIELSYHHRYALMVGIASTRTGQHPWPRPGWKILPTRIGYCSNTNGDRRFRCEDKNVAFTNVQPHHYRMRQVEPRYHSGWISQALIFSFLGLGAMHNKKK